MDTNAFPSSVAVLGSTGSVGRQALEVAKWHGTPIDLLTANSNVAVAEEQIRSHTPRTFVMVSEEAARDLRVRVADTGTRVLSGAEGVVEAIAESDAPVFIHSILGEAGLRPLLAAIDSGKRIGLANKESLVIAGDIINERLKSSTAFIVPVDSEQSAIFQCLAAGRHEEISSLWLTASGGPFRKFTREQLTRVTRDKALLHPTWSMGAKITVDSATMMNKGFEVIEAVHLFGVSADKIRVIVHPESIIHSAVEYIDSAVIAQMSLPDMRLCIQYAMTYPNRTAGCGRPLSLAALGSLSFYEPNNEVFPLLPLAYRALSLGGGVPAALNAANEIAVESFLQDGIGFTEISDIVTETVEEMSWAADACSLEERIAADREARRVAAQKIQFFRK